MKKGSDLFRVRLDPIHVLAYLPLKFPPVFSRLSLAYADFQVGFAF
ncbi:MAG: hypothetical protein Q4F30_10415 [Akkermansia sp.]|nr:hypothetical protein [Akkermansia sp.]